MKRQISDQDAMRTAVQQNPINKRGLFHLTHAKEYRRLGTEEFVVLVIAYGLAALIIGLVLVSTGAIR